MLLAILHLYLSTHLLTFSIHHILQIELELFSRCVDALQDSEKAKHQLIIQHNPNLWLHQESRTSFGALFQWDHVSHCRQIPSLQFATLNVEAIQQHWVQGSASLNDLDILLDFPNQHYLHNF